MNVWVEVLAKVVAIQEENERLQTRVKLLELSTTRQIAQADGLENRVKLLEAEVIGTPSRDDPLGQRPRLLAGVVERHDVLRTTVDLLSAKVQALADRPVEGVVFYRDMREGVKLDAKSLAMRKALDKMPVWQGPCIWYNAQAPVSEKAWKNLEPVHDWEGPRRDSWCWRGAVPGGGIGLERRGGKDRRVVGCIMTNGLGRRGVMDRRKG